MSTLPIIPAKQNVNDYYRVPTPSASTMDTDPPSAWRYENIEALLRLVRPALDPRPTGTFLNFAPLDDECGFLASEGDVFAATMVHLVNPVNIAMKRHLQGASSLIMTCEHSTGNARTDIRWTYRRRTIAVLELKPKDALHFRDFENAMAADGAEESRKLRHAQRNQRNEGTLFVNNAFLLMKQAAKYSKTLRVDDVAIFDWNNMFIIDYSRWDEESRHPTLVRGIWVDENPRRRRQDIETFRAALYGFLLRAISRYL